MKVFALALVMLIGCGGDGPWSRASIPTVRSLAAVWAFAANDVWAGGTTLLHYDGASWTPHAAWPANTDVQDLWGFAPNDLWAVGNNKVFQWNGSAWREVAIGPSASQVDLNAIWGVSARDLWVGGGINGEAFHYTGTTWIRTITQAVIIQDLWGSAANDVWAAGQFGLSRWNGTAWMKVDSNDVTSPSGLWGFGANDVWVAGGFGTLSHWDGRKWTKTPYDEDNHFGDHVALWGRATDDLWAVGENGIVSHWKGTKWSSSNLSETVYLGGISGSPAGDIWIVGNDLRAAKGLVYHQGP